jgi:hypothetical protein
VFLIQPQYDMWQILHVHSQAYTPTSVTAFGAQLVKHLQTALFAASTAMHGAFVDSCTRHAMYMCLGRHENIWSGHQIRSTIAVNHTLLHARGLRDEGEHTNWNAAEAFARWYRHSLIVDHLTTTTTTTTTTTVNTQQQELVGMVPGLNWYFQDQDFPCRDCCACSPRIAGQFAPPKPRERAAVSGGGNGLSASPTGAERTGLASIPAAH